MKLILSVKNGQYYLEKVLKIKEGIRTIRTNNQDKIFVGRIRKAAGVQIIVFLLFQYARYYNSVILNVLQQFLL